MKKNILVVDDSALMRRVVSDIINSDSDYQVTDLCKNGLEAYKKILDNHYDAVILDVIMPVMTGIELLERLQKDKIKVSVIMCSTITTDNSAESTRALELSAVDFIEKPTNFIEARGETFRNALLSLMHSSVGPVKNKVLPKQAAEVIHKTAASNRQTRMQTAISSSIRHIGSNAKKKIVALACSTGGPKALNSVVPKFPANLDAPVLIVQHMPAGFTGLLAKKLDDMSKVKVKEAEDGEVIKKAHVYIAPGGKHMGVRKDSMGYKIKISDEPPIDALKPCANVMYESLMNSDFDEITCVVLTGMGSDGTKGITNLETKKNIYVVAQNASTCVVYGMPKSVYEAGLVDEVLPLEDIAGAVQKNVGVQ